MRTILVIVLALSCFLGKADTMQYDVYKRSYIKYIPASYNKKKPTALIIVLHGGGGKAKHMVRFTGFNRYADKDTCIVVYPQGYKKHWNDGRHSEETANRLGIDDVGFINALIEKLEKEYNINTNRIYACGPSNGGMMCYRLACELPGKFAAVAPVIANMPVDIKSACSTITPVSMLIINGTHDPLMPYEGGEVHFYKKMLGKVLSTKETVKFWTAKNGCAEHSNPEVQVSVAKGDDETVVECDAYYNERKDVEVRLYTIRGGGHTWPGGMQYLPKFVVGITSRKIDATAVIWEFFKQHPKVSVIN